MRGSASFQAPPGFRESPGSPLAQGEVVASTYVIRSELARTETGLVFEARDMMLDRPVAFKLAWRDPGLPSLILEARRCASVADPCAVAIHGMGNHNGVEFVVGERVTGRLLRDLVTERLSTDLYLAKLRMLIKAVAVAHESGIAIGDISGATVLVCDQATPVAHAREVDPAHQRLVLGRISLSQVPAFGPHGQILAPEVVRGEVEPGDPAAAEAIDLYGLGCVAIELACGKPPFADVAADAELRGHAYEPPPRLVDLRDDLPAELSDLVEWMLAKEPAGRPRTARDVLAQLDCIVERVGTRVRSTRVLVVDGDTARARWLWSLARRAHGSTVVETASEGTEAAHKLNRDQPDLIFVDANLGGVMNALELCMYTRGLEVDQVPQIIVIGEVTGKDRDAFAGVDASILAESAELADTVLTIVRQAAAEPPRRRRPRKTISG